MAAKYMLVLACAAWLASLSEAGHHKKVIIHVPYKVHHHHHKHTIIKHIHHKPKESHDDHYEVLGYTYGEPKAAPHFSGGHDHSWGAAEESHDESHDSPVSFEGGDHGISAAGDEHSYGQADVGGLEHSASEHGY